MSKSKRFKKNNGKLKPIKKTDNEIRELIARCITDSKYVFVSHARDRQSERHINDLTVMNILENKGRARRSRNKGKDKCDGRYDDWNYCIEGYDPDGEKVRIVISFDQDFMLIITVIRIQQEGA